MTDFGTITVHVGTVQTGSSGQTNDNRRVVQFEAQNLGSVTIYAANRDGDGITDTRGVTETLYKTTDGQLVVHADDWSRWQGEPSTESLHEVFEDDLQNGGEYERLGAECGFGAPLTLDEYFAEPE